ncbi:dihydroorotate dehydrogenase (quinone) [Moraxella caviae]|uniref:Dihydroorotate dehydrogenase (quinone) n=1 Tax=Moraxella caviae TaxID=34060 RepID=A0A1T0A711_9GAMM|nr:quinone-dependent dihydroorotate dehydrogenase [Moraxella caviae]OOR91535.1 dihydroorotate dehydrogenase (quinone) [Moraxella caviae]STZ14379.1 Dihydroorotate dehydrogenase (quinone) [Moraxella caviae]VEW10535.1 Dihydroorotate dehydrogenase (quinone) [Moraxella caviae]
MYSLLRPFLFSMEPERAHEFTLSMLDKAHSAGLLGFAYSKQALGTTCMGIHLPNPVGLAAGLDKNGAHIDALSELGFGFLEVGTVTPRPQAGNDKPRLFRLKEARAIINRMGFNNDGVEQMIANIERAKYKGVLGINIGKNAITPVENALDDYVYCLERVYPYASYITVNISSPNTKNLRSLQSADALSVLLDGIKTCHSRLANDYGFYVPLALKIAPDLDDEQIDEIARTVAQFDIDGLIATNTTLSRAGVEDLPHGDEAGGLSGRPVRQQSTKVLSQFAERLAGSGVDLIGVGGIDDGAAAVKKLEAGAKAVQVYSGLIYKGPALVSDCVQSIAGFLDKQASL